MKLKLVGNLKKKKLQMNFNPKHFCDCGKEVYCNCMPPCPDCGALRMSDCTCPDDCESCGA